MVQTTTSSTLKNFYGGDYAGHHATFSQVDGSLIPVPEHYVPDSLIEWGMIPTAFEVITSEDISKDVDDNGLENGKDDKCKIICQRNTIKVMPEVGCGLDNLDVIRDTEEWLLQDNITESSLILSQPIIIQQVDGSIQECQCSSLYNSGLNRLEIIFTIDSYHKHAHYVDINGEKDQNNVSGEQRHRRRIRVAFQLENSDGAQSNKITKPIDIIQERQTSSESSQGNIAQGGGLDARTVTRLIGKENSNHPFSDGKALDLETTMVGQWMIQSIPSSLSSKETKI